MNYFKSWLTGRLNLTYVQYNWHNPNIHESGEQLGSIKLGYTVNHYQSRPTVLSSDVRDTVIGNLIAFCHYRGVCKFESLEYLLEGRPTINKYIPMKVTFIFMVKHYKFVPLAISIHPKQSVLM